MERTSRIAKWDNIKFILILCVVVGHFLSRYTDDSMNAKRLVFFIYTFHMPAFVFMSGLFAKKTIDERRYEKAFGFFMLYLVTKYALFLVKVIRGNDLEFSYFEMNDVSWYAFAMFIFCIETMYFRRFRPIYMLVISILISCISGYASDIGTFLSLSRILTYYPFFLLGYYLKSEEVLAFTQKKVILAASWVVLIITVLVVYFKIDKINWYLNILKGKHGYDSLKYASEYGFALRLGWYALALVLTITVISLTPSFQSIFATIGSRTMQIYALHYIPMLVFFGNLRGEAWAKNVWPDHHIFLIILISVVVTCVLAVRPITVVMDWLIYPKLKETRGN